MEGANSTPSLFSRFEALAVELAKKQDVLNFEPNKTQQAAGKKPRQSFSRNEVFVAIKYSMLEGVEVGYQAALDDIRSLGSDNGAD